MNYEKLISTMEEIVNNNEIYKHRLTMVYELSEKAHRKMNEEIYIKINQNTNDILYTDEFVVEIGGIYIRFIKKDIAEEEEIKIV